MRHSLVTFCLLVVLACALPAGAQVYYGDFDWRDNGGNYVTPIRNQGSCGSCWAFGATAGLESQFLINAGTPGINLNLSEQHLLCDGSCGSCGGGYEYKALNFFVNNGITSEATLPYRASNTSPNWPLEAPYTLYKTTSVDTYCTGWYTTTSEIKNWLEETGPLPCAINTAEWFNPGTLAEEAACVGMDFSTPEWVQATSSLLDPDDPVGGINHAVCIVGYKDVPSMSEGGYWIVKNSWGNWGDSGYGFFKYGDIEKHSRVHAVTGNTFTEFIEPPNYAPVAVNDNYTVTEDGRIVVYSYNGVLANDTDKDTPHANLTADQLTDPEHGTLELGPNGWLTYTPDQNYHGTDRFTYRAYDGELFSTMATVNLDVVSVNDAPVAVDDAFGCNQGESLMLYGYEGVMVNDTDVDNLDQDLEYNDTLTAVLQSGPSNGTITWYASGGFRYIPDSTFSGTDTFTYQVFDGAALSNLATVLIEVLAAAVPVAGDATGDGVVDEFDAAILNSNWGKETTGGISAGDFNTDGRVNAIDASIMAANWGDHRESTGETAVPEPSILAMLLVSSAILLFRRRNRG